MPPAARPRPSVRRSASRRSSTRGWSPAARTSRGSPGIPGEPRDVLAAGDPGLVTGSEDVSWFSRDAGVALVFWFWGGIDPQVYARAVGNGTLDSDIPTNHSPFFAPVIHPTIEVGVAAMVTVAREFLD